MNEHIVRTEKQVLEHIAKLEALADSKNEKIAKVNYGLSTLLGNYYANDTLDPQEYVDNNISKYDSFNKEEKLQFDLRLWLIGRFFTAPSYNPVEEEQFSTEQVLEDFGKTSYTDFKIG